MKIVFKPAIHRVAVDISISSKLSRIIDSQELVEKAVVCFTKMPTFTAGITKLVKTHAVIAFMNEARFCDGTIDV